MLYYWSFLEPTSREFMAISNSVIKSEVRGNHSGEVMNELSQGATSQLRVAKMIINILNHISKEKRLIKRLQTNVSQGLKNKNLYFISDETSGRL